MVSFIIYEDEKKYREKYISVIIKLMGKKTDDYSIIEFSKYDNEVKNTIMLPGKKIYILDIEVPGKSGLDLAREIRNGGDWESQIIIVTTHDSLQQVTFTSRLLTLDFISKYNNLMNNLRRSLLTSYIITTSYKSIKTQKDGEFYQFFYNDIIYIKKEPKDLDVNIYFADGSYREVKESISKLETELSNDPRFFRTHRSCIVNITKIESVNFNEGIINFKNRKTSLLSRDRKKEFKKMLYNNLITNDDKNHTVQG